MEKINKLKAYFLIKNSKGLFCSAIFQKKDKTFRKMLFRLGVKKGITGAGLRYNPENYLLMPVYDIKKQNFRMINLDTLQKIKIRGASYAIN